MNALLWTLFVLFTLSIVTELVSRAKPGADGTFTGADVTTIVVRVILVMWIAYYLFA